MTDKHGIESVRDINQIANCKMVNWNDNIAISNGSPTDYRPEYAKRFKLEELTRISTSHALP